MHITMTIEEFEELIFLYMRLRAGKEEELVDFQGSEIFLEFLDRLHDKGLEPWIETNHVKTSPRMRMLTERLLYQIRYSEDDKIIIMG